MDLGSAIRVLTLTMKEHHASENTALVVVERLLRSWEIDFGLLRGPQAISFEFDRAELVDRNPPPPEQIVHRGIASVSLSVSGVAKYTIGHPHYPEPPTDFLASPDVQTMWFRYQMYREGKEPLLSMAYFCLSLLEGTTGKKEGARKAVCSMYGIDQDLREKLGDILSEKGSPTEARTLDFLATKTPLTETEKEWVENVVKALIRRKGEFDANPSASRPPITLASFVQL